MPEERRVVTILFADVTGSTAMGESSDPEDVRALLGRYYGIAREVIAAHGGTLEKFIGDSVMAVFGIPQAHGDDAERALAAALALREAVAKDPQTAALALRMGVNTGEVVAARESAAGDFLVTGDAVNVAARLQQHAEPGGILVGERTRRAVSTFRFADEQQIAVKGKREPIGGSILLERLAERRVARAPFLGREHDLAQLDLVAQRAFGERRPQLVTITAPAGTGKSRLVEEFATRLADERVIVATAQCLPYGAAVTFLPLRGLVRGLLGITRTEDAAPLLRDVFVSAGHGAEEAGRLALLIGTTLGDTPDSERRDREEIFSAWRLLIEALALRGPLLVVFEDLHWASDTLLDLVEHVTTSRTTAPLVMFALARPELLDRRPTWGGGRRNFTSIGLEPLTSEETLRLVSIMTESVPGPIANAIVERAGGNPFFVGELVRAYEELHRAGKRDEEITLPDTVHATVLSRIDALPPPERSVLEYAAVAGRTARVAAVGALLAELPETTIADAFDALADRDLLVAQGGGAYTFRHIVIREVAYATLPRAERVRAHIRLAHWLEEQSGAGQEFTELIAYHYRQAIALSPGNRVPDGLAVDAVAAALERAARAAANVGAFREAAEQMREAMRLSPPSEHLRQHELVGDLMQFGDEAITGYAEAVARWRAQADGDPRTGARLIVKQLGVAARWAGSISKPMEPAEFATLAAEARRLLDRGPDPLVEAKLAFARAFHVMRAPESERGELRELAGEVERSRTLYAERGDIEAESEALDALASLERTAFGDPERALAYTRERLAKVDRLSLLERIDAWSVAIWDLVYLGRHDEATDTYRDARRSLRASEPVYMTAHSAAWATYAAMLCGRWDEVFVLGDLMVTMLEESRLNAGRFMYPGWVAALRVAAARGDTTRLARYRSAFVNIANVPLLAADSRPFWVAFIDRDAAAARAAVTSQIGGGADRKGELIALLLFDLGEQLMEEELRTVERRNSEMPPVLRLRVELARALNAGDADVRRAIASLDAGHLVADAARAATLLALRTRDENDRADADRRLAALGDRQYLQKLAEEW
ncbi:MAG TPA: adenylate/guanylate cyclase domain-containing protein [Candidatus Limnocylindria bacterium]|nr:adenylate/guanylate cyclase domain-containing protein [Candidatus Limnocylindria bacterium]